MLPAKLGPLLVGERRGDKRRRREADKRRAARHRLPQQRQPE